MYLSCSTEPIATFARQGNNLIIAKLIIIFAFPIKKLKKMLTKQNYSLPLC